MLAHTVAVVEADRLTKLYGSARGIEGMSFEIEHGEVFGLLGPNGAGKTTTIRTLLDLLHPTSGSATIFGYDSRRDGYVVASAVGEARARGLRHQQKTSLGPGCDHLPDAAMAKIEWPVAL